MSIRKPYLAGSICSLQPQSKEDDVNMFLEMMELTSKADEVITVESLLDGVFARPLLSPLIVSDLSLQSNPSLPIFHPLALRRLYVRC